MKKIHIRFNVKSKNQRPRKLLMPIEWAGTYPVLWFTGCKIRRHNMKGIKHPYLILSNHASMIDFQICVKATFPHRVHWVISIEEFVGREWLMRGVGGIPKRKFTTGSVLIKQILDALRHDKKSVVIYPEARYSLAGITEDIGSALGKLALLAKVPVVVINEKGNFIKSPQWCKHPTRPNRVEADITCVYDPSKENLSADEIQKRIEDAFVYDDYKWQYDNKIKIRTKKRAENIHKILYKCPNCNSEFHMKSKDFSLWCENCHSKWDMNYYGRLEEYDSEGKKTGKEIHVPDWYKWERKCVNEEVENGTYHFEDDVRVEELFNSHIGFYNQGKVHMVQDLDGIHLHGTLDNGMRFDLDKDALSTASIHIEYNFKKRGDAIDIATLEGTWFVYPINMDNVLTKIHFATEAIYNNAKKKKE